MARKGVCFDLGEASTDSLVCLSIVETEVDYDDLFLQLIIRVGFTVDLCPGPGQPGDHEFLEFALSFFSSQIASFDAYVLC